MKMYQGIAASPGYALGPVYPVARRQIVAPRRAIAADEVSAEIERFRTAVKGARDQIQDLVERLSAELGGTEADILASQLLVLEDELVWDATQAVIRLELINAEAAFSRAMVSAASPGMTKDRMPLRSPGAVDE